MNKPDEIRALTGLRGIAALDVAITHINSGSNTLISLFGLADPAVDYFFCLSGFTLFLVYGQNLAEFKFRPFLIARFARVYPLYILVLGIAAIYNFEFGYFIQYSDVTEVLDGLRQIAMVNAWPVIGSGTHWAAPMWSLSIEAFCYVFLFPVLAKVLTKTTTLSLNTCLSLAMILPFFALWFDHPFYNPAVNEQFVPVSEQLPHWVAIVRGISMFSTGWVCFRIWRDHKSVTAEITRHADVVAIAFLVIVVGSILGVMDRYLIILLAPALIILSRRSSLSLQMLYQVT